MSLSNWLIYRNTVNTHRNTPMWVGEVKKIEGNKWCQKLFFDLKTQVVIFHWDWEHFLSGRTLGPLENFLDHFYNDPEKLRVKKCLPFNHFCIKHLLLCCIIATSVEVMKFFVDFQSPFLTGVYNLYRKTAIEFRFVIENVF